MSLNLKRKWAGIGLLFSSPFIASILTSMTGVSSVLGIAVGSLVTWIGGYVFAGGK